jgi:hypothetical protein
MDKEAIAQRARELLIDACDNKWTNEQVAKGNDTALISAKYALRAIEAILALQSSERGEAKPTARDLFEIARPCFHYARRGTGDGSMFEASETGRLLMKAMEAIAATLSPAEPSPESREGAQGAICNIPNCRRACPAHEPFCSEHRQ